MSRTPSSASEDDTDSLFGSPPPEATALAETEVGSIALPGTHMSCSGLPTVLAIPDSSNREADQPHVNTYERRDNATGETLHGPQYPPTHATDKEKRRKRPTTSVTTAATTLSRDDIIERARQRQRQLIAEIECAKVELWETSIEGGALVHLVRDQLKQTARSGS
ncbi:hypothetical protein BKA82DRAFT_197241 [Pisolithus tinctorius]|uniref:Uncharacterized protein n=1 Tax=Pisolithus tinctorius Marx 270 TaxID=870435 RepID=A0A0C3PL79_PISTI|nr:hypothetical protein BKA82DRAFT_197241 [Pisolithus tinctorius]KIO15030.1 hypothetical protein M404DRAFT_197241 [Pisolithus tinctorius Marx 270]